MTKQVVVLLLLLSGNIYAQNIPFEDPYGDTITTVNDIDVEFFQDVLEEILFEIEEYGFEEAVGAIVDSSGYIHTYENYIDLPAQFTNSLVHNKDFGEVRMIYNFGPSQKIREDIAREWYEGLVKLFNDGNIEREWGFYKKTEPNVAGLPERTTFFYFMDDYSSNYVEIYYSRSRVLFADEETYEGRVVIIFAFPGY